jgi:hypothetical protein
VNLDFSVDPMFSWYVVLLAVSGVVLLVLAAVSGSGQATGMRVFNALVGAAFLGYGFYLAFLFEGETYIIFFKAFFVPVLLIANFFQSSAARRRARAIQPQSAPQPVVQQPAVPDPAASEA